jgi:hypothetical protein
MRQSVPLAPVRPASWKAAGARGIELLPLNHDPGNGARTALIRSVPREGVECKAQYHHCEEEFLCLAGRFTFDGLHWMRPWSYACYPSQVVHGARVSVPGGYLLYLRTSGSTQAYAVAEPVSDEAYHQPDSPALEPIVVLENALERVQEHRVGQAPPTRIRRRILRAQPEKDAEVALWEFDPGARDLFRHFPAATPLEVLIVRAGAETADVTGADSLAYGCYGPGDARPSIDAEGRVVALVHSGSWA